MKLHTILCPTDFSESSHYAFHLAMSLARDHGAQVVVAHVMAPPLAYDEVVASLPPEFYKEKIWESFRNLEASDPRVRELRVETKLVEGDPIAEIVGLAEETACDLIVMGTHGRSGLRRLLMGSVAENVLRKAPCPVLTVKGPMAALETKENGAAAPAAAH
ncbi:MAG: universal stress protein [Gemmataceae bacterium]